MDYLRDQRTTQRRELGAQREQAVVHFANRFGLVLEHSIVARGVVGYERLDAPAEITVGRILNPLKLPATSIWCALTRFAYWSTKLGT